MKYLSTIIFIFFISSAFAKVKGKKELGISFGLLIPNASTGNKPGLHAYPGFDGQMHLDYDYYKKEDSRLYVSFSFRHGYFRFDTDDSLYRSTVTYERHAVSVMYVGGTCGLNYRQPLVNGTCFRAAINAGGFLDVQPNDLFPSRPGIVTSAEAGLMFGKRLTASLCLKRVFPAYQYQVYWRFRDDYSGNTYFANSIMVDLKYKFVKPPKPSK